jgi:lipopolysaccharide export system permease protein
MFEVNSNADSLKALNPIKVKSGNDIDTSSESSHILRPAKLLPIPPSLKFGSSVAAKGDAVDTTLSITPKDFENNAHEYDGMTIPELGHQIAQLKFRGTTGVEAYETERHIRFAAPCTTFVLVFMGVIVSARKSRGGTGFQIALGFLLAFVFILFFTMTRTFAETGSLTPVVAAWLPNSIFTVISLFMYKYVPR